MNSQALAQRVATFNSTMNRIEQQIAAESSTISRLKTKINQIEIEKTQLVKAVGLIDRAIQIISANGIGKIESIVTAGLQLVYNDPHMGLVVEKKEGARGNTYRLLVREGEFTSDPLNSRGGGVINVISFLLRLILIKRFKLAQFIVLDESFNNVSPEYQPQVSELLHEMCSKYKFTIFAITHNQQLVSRADNVYRVIVNCEACGTDLFSSGSKGVCRKCGGKKGRSPILKKLDESESQITG